MDHERLEEIAQQSEIWSIPTLKLQLCPTKKSTEIREYNLVCECAVAKQQDATDNIRADENQRLWFPPSFNVDNSSSRIRIGRQLMDAVKPHNMELAIGRHYLTRDKLSRHIYWVCPRGVRKRKSLSKSIRNTPSLRPQAGVDLCPFQIRVTADRESTEPDGPCRYYIRTNAGQCFDHCNHAKRSSIAHAKRHVPKEVLDLVCKMFIKHCPTAVAKSLIFEMTGKDLTMQTIRKLKQGAIKAHIDPHGLSDTQGEQLLELLKTSPDQDYIYFTASVDLSSKLLTIKKTSKKETNECFPQGTLKDDMMELLRGLFIEDGGSVLVAVCWTSDQQRRYFQMFPEVIGFDITHKTNAEKRPMFIIVARTSNGKNIPIMNAFCPSEAKWVFNWMFEDALPYLFGKPVLQRVRLATTDQDPQCNDAFSEAMVDYFPNARMRLCKWHKVRCCQFVL